MRHLLLLGVALLACFCGQHLVAAAARLPPGAAGSKGSTRRGLISNGEDAPAGRYPYMCALGRVGRAGNTVSFDDQQCGGTLIHPQVVLTAAHCAADERGFLMRSLAVLCNTTRLGATSGGAQFRRVQQILIHNRSEEARAIAMHTSVDALPPDGEAFTSGDVGLLLLDSPIEGVQPVAVPTPEQWAEIGTPGQEVRTAGWGAMQEGRSPRNFPRTLQEAALPLVSPEKCNSEDQYEAELDPAVSICAGFSVGARSLPCHGDSGGPLLYTPNLGDPSTHVQVGVVSGGAGKCDGPSLPGVFARLDAYSSWISSALAMVDQQQRLPDGPGQATAPAAAGPQLQSGGGPQLPATGGSGSGSGSGSGEGVASLGDVTSVDASP